jgi:tetratricopeptide (TPR) repeat protein
MPTINKPFLLKLVLAALALVGLVVGTHAVQARRIPDALLRQADRAADADKSQAAVHYLRQYLEFRPGDTDSQERLAELLKARPGHNPSDLLLLYDKILRADPSRDAIRREALTVCLQIRRYTDAETHAETLLKAAPTDAELWQMLAAAQASLQKTAEARKSYEAAVQHEPGDPVPYQRLAQYLWRDLKLTPDAKEVIEKLVTALPHDPEAYLTRARFELANEDAAKALTDLRKALELDPENADALLLLAEQYQKQRKLAQAHDCLAAGMRLYPKDVRLVRSLAWLELNRGNIGSAVAILEDGMGRVPNSFDLLVPLADLLVQLGETERTEGIIQRLERRTSDTARLQVKYLKTRVAMRQAGWARAVELLTALRTETGERPGLEAQTNLLLAICYQRQGKTTEEQETLRLLLNKNPNHGAGRVALAQSYLNSGRVAEAIREYEHAVKSPYASPGTHATLLRLKARELALAGGRPQDWQQLDRIAVELAKAYGPAASEPALIRAGLADARGDYRKAAAILRAEAARRPGDVRLWAALADGIADIAGVAAGLGVLDEAQAATGDGPELRLARANLYARDPSHLRPIDPLGGQLDAWPDADQTKLLFGLIEVYDRLGDEARVVRTYQRIAARRPADLGVWEVLGEWATQSGDTATATDARAHAVKLDPTGKSAALFDAWAALASKNSDAARPAIETLTTAFGANPDRAEACVALARLKALAGEGAEAGRLFERAVRLEPTRFPPMRAYLRHLATADDAAAPAILARLARDHRWAGEPFRRAVRGSLSGLPADAAKKLLAAARQYVEPEPDGLGWLGEAYRAIGMRSEALECFEKATATKVANADDWLRLALNAPNADRVLPAAREKLPPQLFFATAAAFAESKAAPKGWSPKFDKPADKKLFAQARLSLKLSRLERSEAIALLESFLKDKPEVAADAAWGRRNLAMLLAVRGGAADRAKAMRLLKSDDSAGETADEKRSTAAVLTALSRHLDGADRKEVFDRAIKVLEGLVGETRSPRDAYLLAQVYRAAGHRKACIQVLNELLQADGKNLDYLVMALNELAEDGNFDLARQFADRLLALYPNEFRALAPVARFECRAGNADRAFVLAEGYTRMADAAAGDTPARSARVAELLDELSRLPKVRRTETGRRMAKSAVEKYESLITARPEAVVAAAGLLAASERYADAFTLIDKYAKSLPARLRAAAGLAALRAGGASERQFAHVRAWLDAALAEQPDSLTLRLNEGEFFALRRDYAAAEKAYGAVLAKDPRNVVALNNLAWILAPNPARAEEALKLVDQAVSEVGLTGELLDTRARIRIAAKQFERAEKDLLEALSQEKTPLRLFHLALAKDGQSPAKKDEARDDFRQAKERGLDPRSIHPADLPRYRVLDAEKAN